MDSIDEQLLRQFSRLGTTDKDELIRQLQILLGHHISYNTAQFFLDMSDWNLQAAIGSYFDFGTPAKLPSMTLQRDPLCTNDVLITTPNTPIRKVWVLYNNGSQVWPDGCYLKFSGGDNMCVTDRLKIARPIQPGESAVLVGNLNSPSSPGVYRSKWRLSTPNGAFFGDILWIIMSVIESESSEVIKRKSDFNSVGENPSNFLPETNPFLNPFGEQQHPSTFQRPESY